MMEGSIDQVLNLSLRNPVRKNKKKSRNVIFAYYQIYYEDGFGEEFYRNSGLNLPVLPSAWTGAPWSDTPDPTPCYQSLAGPQTLAGSDTSPSTAPHPSQGFTCPPNHFPGQEPDKGT